MSSFLNVLKFELGNFFKNKSYLITTIVIVLLLTIGLALPSFIEIPGINDKKSDVVSVDEDDKKDKIKLGLYDENNNIKDVTVLDKYFKNVEWITCSNKDELIEKVEDEDVEAGFSVDSLTKYKYYINNTIFDDSNETNFKEALSEMYREDTINELGVDYKEIDSIYNKEIKGDVKVLGKDSVSNYLYTYLLIFVLFFMIVFYGQTIATSVTSEKSNRAMEVLVTSTSPNSLIFGKVIAGAIASIVQVVVIIGSALINYKIHCDAWNNELDFIFDVPASAIATFAVFGLIGFLLYAFIWGVMGALVSKVEDLSKSVMPFNLILVVVFYVTLFGLTNSDSSIIKIASYIPFSSCFAMFARVAMGSVAIYEVIISLVILVGSTVIFGIVGAKIYRMGTLKMGNQIKLSNAFKSLKEDK